MKLKTILQNIPPFIPNTFPGIDENITIKLIDDGIGPDSSSEDEEHLLGLIKEHAAQTGSKIASDLVENWEEQRGYFWKAMPAQFREKKMTVKDILKKVEESR